MNLIRSLPLTVGMFFGAEGHSFGASATTPTSDFRLSGVSLEHSVHKGEPAFRITMPHEAIQDPQKEQLADRDFHGLAAFGFW
jgi:hypothetical protein